MPTFDIVSKIDLAEVDNAINGAMREIGSRYDFKNSKSNIIREELKINIVAEDKYKIEQAQQIIRTHFVKRKLDTSALDFLSIMDGRSGLLKQDINIKQGIDKETSQKIIKEIKNNKLKVQCSIRGEELRVSSNKRDILQDAIQIIKNKKFNIPLQYINFRD